MYPTQNSLFGTGIVDDVMRYTEEDRKALEQITKNSYVPMLHQPRWPRFKEIIRDTTVKASVMTLLACTLHCIGVKTLAIPFYSMALSFFLSHVTVRWFEDTKIIEEAKRNAFLMRRWFPYAPLIGMLFMVSVSFVNQQAAITSSVVLGIFASFLVDMDACLRKQKENPR